MQAPVRELVFEVTHQRLERCCSFHPERIEPSGDFLRLQGSGALHEQRLVEPLPDIAGRTAPNEQRRLRICRVDKQHVGEIAVRDGHLLALHRVILHAPFAPRGTTFHQWANQAPRRARCALHRPEIHDGLVVVGRALGHQQRSCQLSKLLLAGCDIDRGVDGKIAREHPIDIPVHYGCG